jgi:hypothetical protein
MDPSNRDRQILAFERRRWLHPGAKDTAIRETFGVTPWRYQQELLALLDRPEALQHDPQLVLRLRRLREHRQQHRRTG